MTVGELKASLETFDDDSEVVIEDTDQDMGNLIYTKITDVAHQALDPQGVVVILLGEQS